MALRSWIASANDSGTGFPLDNLPYGVFRGKNAAHVGVAIGDQILDLRKCASVGLLAGLPPLVEYSCTASVLNSFMSLGQQRWSALRSRVTTLLTDTSLRSQVEQLLVSIRDAAMQLPAQIAAYTDFYASIHHATRVGKLFRPDIPLLPNY